MARKQSLMTAGSTLSARAKDSTDAGESSTSKIDSSRDRNCEMSGRSMPLRLQPPTAVLALVPICCGNDGWIYVQAGPGKVQLAQRLLLLGINRLGLKQFQER